MEGTLSCRHCRPGSRHRPPTTDTISSRICHRPPQLSRRRAGLAALGGRARGGGVQPAIAASVGLHWSIYWGLTQKIYRLESDPSHGLYCSDPLESVRLRLAAGAHRAADRSRRAHTITGCASSRTRHPGSHPGSGEHRDIQRRHHAPRRSGSLLPHPTDSDIYSQLVARAHKSSRYRYYVVQGGNHVDPQYDDHAGSTRMATPCCGRCCLAFAQRSTRWQPGSS